LRKTVPLLLLLVLIPVAYFGFRDLFTANIKKVSVSKSTGFGKVNPNFFAVFDDRPALRLFERALAKAEKQPGIVDAVEPHYDVEIHYSNGRTKGLHLWLFPESSAGSIMHVTSTSTIYTLPKDIAGELIELLEPYATQLPDERRDSADADQSADEKPDPARGESSALPSEDPDASQPPDYRSASIFSLVAGDTPISIGAWDNEVDLESILGPPASQTVEVLENADTHTGSFLKKMDYDELRLELFSPKQNGETFWILSMKASGEGYRTTREIAVGSPLKEMLEAYPEIVMAPDGRTDPDNAAYVMTDEMGELYLRFEVADGRVAEIQVYRVLP
jgi:hypothetical protein